MADSSQPWISCRAYAKHRGCTPMAVSSAISAGRLSAPAVIYIGEPPQPKIANVALADEQWARNTDPVRAANANAQRPAPEPPRLPVLVGPTPPPRALVEQALRAATAPPADLEGTATATERLKSAQADLAELKRDAERGTLVLAKDVERRLIAVFSACKTRLLAIPSRARQALPQLTNADVLVVEALVREALEELAEAEPAP